MINSRYVPQNIYLFKCQICGFTKKVYTADIYNHCCSCNNTYSTNFLHNCQCNINMQNYKK